MTGAEEWQRQHGYENTWWWPHLDEVLRKLNAFEINVVLDSRFDPFAAPKLLMKIGTRTDRTQTMEEKTKSVKNNMSSR